MVIKSNSRRKGMQRGGVQRGMQTKAGSLRKSSSKMISAIERWIEELTVVAYGKMIGVCIALNLVPLTKTLDGFYEIKPKRELIAYKVYQIIAAFIMVYRAGAAVKACTQGEFTAQTLLAVVEGLAYFDAWAITIYNASETVILLNNFNMVLSYLQVKRGQELTMFGDLRLSLKVISTVTMIPLCIVTVAVANGFMYGGLPTSFIRLADVFIDISSENRIWWQLLFLPLEIFSVFTVLFTAFVVCTTAFITLHLSKIFGQQIRDINVVDLTSREEVERMYICWELYEKIARPWLMPHGTAIIVSISCAAVVNIFVAIKYTNLPIVIYCVQAVLGPAFVFLLFVGLYDAVIVSQLSVEVLTEQLKKFTLPGLSRVTLKDRRELLKRVKAMSPISIPIGSFTTVQFIVLIAIWDEIVNQVLFLLSL